MPYSAERIARVHDAAMTCEFGIPFLADALIAIRPCDLIILGGKTGAGKTQLGSHIAIHNVLKTRRVCFIGLEAEKYEIERRLKFSLLANRFFATRDKFPPEIKLTFTEWLHDKYGTILDGLEDEVDHALEYIKQNLTIYSPDMSEFSKHDFSIVYDEFAKDHELIILDHIHYLSPNERENEHEHIKKTMWQLRNSINNKRVPIIAISHLRKEIRRDDSLVPSLEELHGSSEISKQANHVVVFAPAYAVPKKSNPEQTIDPPVGTTFCKILKSRTGHAGATRYIAVMKFNSELQAYEDKYVPYEVDRHATKLTPMGYQDFERWMGLGREALA